MAVRTTSPLRTTVGTTRQLVTGCPMRTPLDRFRHAVSFELVALVLVIPLGAFVFDTPIEQIGVVSIVGATLATLWNMIYNHVFDHVLQYFCGTTLKSPKQRILHALLFELGLLIVLMPFFAWYLEVSLWQAFVMDFSFALFYVLYALVFNWVYDILFPLPEWRASSLDHR